MSGEVGIHLEYVEQVVAVYLVQVAVGQSANVARRLSDRLMYTHVLTEHVVFTCNPPDTYTFLPRDAL